MSTMTIYVKEATEEHSIQALESMLVGMVEIERALVDIEEGEIKITYDEAQIAEEQIIRRIQLDGFEVRGA